MVRHRAGPGSCGVFRDPGGCSDCFRVGSRHSRRRRFAALFRAGLMRMTAEFQRRHGAATHMLETKTQAAMRGGEGFVRRMVASGILNERSSLVHWSRDDDIAAARAAGVTVVHCPQSNVMLGAGNCPVLRLREAGMQVALGTDGGNCGPANYLENLRFTTGFMRLTEPDFEKWPDSDVGKPTRPAQGRRDGRARPAKSRPTRADLVVLHPLAHGGSLSSSASQRQLGRKRVWVDGRRVRERPRCRRRRGRADRRRDRRPPPGVVATGARIEAQRSRHDAGAIGGGYGAETSCVAALASSAESGFQQETFRYPPAGAGSGRGGTG